MLAGQLQKMRELNEAARYMGEDAIRERHSLHLMLEEVSYRLRFISESIKPGEPEDTGVKQRRQGLLEKLEVLERRDHELNTLVLDMEDASRRLNLLIRQLELAGSQLTRNRSESDNGMLGSLPIDNAWQIALRAQLIEGQEEERSRLAREIHDGPAQVMANAVMQVEFCNQLIQKDKAQAAQELGNLKVTMRESLLELRRFMFNLRPSSLTEQGLATTLQQYFADFSNQYPIQVNAQMPDVLPALPAEQEMAVFRVMQEALQNVRKHSGASKIDVNASLTHDGAVQFSIKDDGRGFDTKKLTPTLSNGSGIPGMRERVEVVGGKFNIKSKIGYGTEIVLILRPLSVK
jgi:two-component system sensor histidine kinase DegS